MGGLRGGYDALRDHHGSSIGGAPIGFVKSGPDEYKSRDDLWTIKHRYKSGYQAHHEWTVYGPDGRLWVQNTHFSHYHKLSDAVLAINRSVAMGIVGFLSGFLNHLRAQDALDAKRARIIETRIEREKKVYEVLNEYGVNTAMQIAHEVVVKLFGEETI